MKFFDKVDELLHAAIPVLDEMKEYLKETGGCDHSVGVCACDLIKKCGRLEAAIAAFGSPRVVKALVMHDSILFVNAEGTMLAEAPIDPFPDNMRELIDRVQEQHNFVVENFDKETGLLIV